jgi:hypothetical protein
VLLPGVLKELCGLTSGYIYGGRYGEFIWTISAITRIMSVEFTYLDGVEVVAVVVAVVVVVVV